MAPQPPADSPLAYHLPALITDNAGRSVWREIQYPIEHRRGMALSPRIETTSMRLRSSQPGYTAEPHLAGEPVLILIQQGTLRIGLPDGSSRDFTTGQAFIAADTLPAHQAFDPSHHGHTAHVIGDTPLIAIHIKLTDFHSPA